MSAGHAVMVVTGLLGAVLTLSLLRAADDGRPVLVAAHEVVPGTVIEADTVRVARLDASDRILASLYRPDELDELAGRVATAPIGSGSLVTRGSVRAVTAGAARRSMSFGIAAARAVGGDLDGGDRVDILAVEADGVDARYVMTDVEVLSVDDGAGGPLGTPDDVTVTIAVDPDGAARLTGALEGGKVTLVRATGAAPIDAPTPAATNAGAGGD
jgi:Flp pilus assembly protein CpaB